MVDTTTSQPRKRTAHLFFRTAGYTILFFGITFSVWAGLKFLQYPTLQGLLRESAQLGLSKFQIAIAFVGLTGLLTTVFVQRRRRGKKDKLRPPKMAIMTFGNQKNAHPLMDTSRPARDTNFVIRKTRNRGRISRNRMGERLPPTFVRQPELETEPGASSGTR